MKAATDEQLAARVVASYTSATKKPSCMLCRHCEENSQDRMGYANTWQCGKLGQPVTPKALCVFFERRGLTPNSLDNGFALARERLGD